MKKIVFITFIMLMTLLTACGGQSEAEQEDNHSEHGEEQDKKDDSLIPVVVEVLVKDQITLGKQTLQAQVTHDEEPIAEADEVTFEVWKKGHEDDSKKIKTTYTEDGIYEATYTFEEEGTYLMYAHVTAKSQHVMPKHEFEVKAK